LKRKQKKRRVVKRANRLVAFSPKNAEVFALKEKSVKNRKYRFQNPHLQY